MTLLFSYNHNHATYPAQTRVIAVSLRKFGQLPLFMSGVVIESVRIIVLHPLNRPSVRSAMAPFILKMPLFGSVVKKNYQAHFCKLLYLLTGSGVLLLYGIGMLQDFITFHPYQLSFEAVASGLRRGESFSANLEKYPKLYSRKLITLLRVGEETNRLPEMLLKQSEDLTRELEYRLKQMGGMLEPLMIFLIGILVAVILIYMYLPMFKLGGVIG